MPRKSEVFDAKTKWALDEEYVSSEMVVENYRSMVGYEKRVKDLFLEEQQLGWMKEMNLEEAQKDFGSDLRLAAPSKRTSSASSMTAPMESTSTTVSGCRTRPSPRRRGRSGPR